MKKSILLISVLFLAGCSQGSNSGEKVAIDTGGSTTITTPLPAESADESLEDFQTDQETPQQADPEPESKDEYKVIASQWGGESNQAWYYLEIENLSDKYLTGLDVKLIGRDASGQFINDASHRISPIPPHATAIAAAGADIYDRDGTLADIEISVTGGTYKDTIREQDENVFSLENISQEDGRVSGEIVIGGSTDYEYHPKVTAVVRRDGQIVEVRTKYSFDISAFGQSSIPFAIDHMDASSTDDVQVLVDVNMSATPK